MLPVDYRSDGTPVFTKDQVDDYGLPEEWGFLFYEVIESKQFAAEYNHNTRCWGRPIHRYNRRQRFYNTLLQLLGDRGSVPLHVLTLVKTYVKPSQDMWNAIRRVLKHFGFRIYYNRIPYIIKQLTQTNSTQKIVSDQYYNIMNEFGTFCFWYELNKHGFNRKYFPNMRFLALKFAKKHGVNFNYDIPLTRTSRKQKELEDIWNSFDLFNS